MTRLIASLIALGLLAACHQGSKSEAPKAGPIASDAGGAPGYQHGLDRSHFSVGENPRRIEEHGLQKVVGAAGTFAVDVRNGAASGTASAARIAAAAQNDSTPPAPERHNQEVLAYFASAGLPRDQVAAIDALTLLAARGETRSTAQPQPRIIGYQSAVRRSIGGVPVVDSVAWARMTARGEVLGEGVYWPAIPAKVIADARSLRERLTDPKGREAYVAALPKDSPAGEVVIHHSSPVEGGPFQAVASYDVDTPVYAPANAPGENRIATWNQHHFGVDGREFQLPAGDRRAAAVKDEAKEPKRK